MMEDVRLMFELAPDLFRRAPDAMIVVDQTGEIRVVNEQALILTGWAETDLLHRKVEELVPEALRAVHEEHRAGYVQDPHTRAMGSGMDLELVRRDGTTVPVEINLSMVTTTVHEPMTITVIRRRSA